MLPVINMNPSDVSCINSTLLFVKDQSHKLNINTPCERSMAILNENIESSKKSAYVLDGGALLHRVIWHGSTFDDVIQQYCEFINSKYGLCSIVFDGYKKQTTKDHEHLRRSQK